MEAGEPTAAEPTEATAAAPAPPSSGATRTLYCSGFPLDVSPREVDFIFRFQPGFEHSKVVDRGKVPIAFVTFTTPENAEATKKLMHGVKLDERSNIEFRLEFAKQTRLGRKREDEAAGGWGGPHEKRPRFGGGEQSSTLMFLNLEAETTEAEILEAVQKMVGFVRHRWSPSKRQGGTPMAYADFESHDAAEMALSTLQSFVLPSVPRGITVKFSEVTMRRPPQRAAFHDDGYGHQAHHAYGGHGGHGGYGGGGGGYGGYGGSVGGFPGYQAQQAQTQAYHQHAQNAPAAAASLAAPSPAAAAAAAAAYGAYPQHNPYQQAYYGQQA